MTTGEPLGHPNDADPIDPHAHPSVWRPRLERMIDRQIELYEQLLDLTSEQDGLIAKDDGGEALIELLRERQGFVDEVASLNEEIEPFVERWDLLSAALESDARAWLTGKLDTLMTLIDRMVSRDEEGKKAIASKRDALAEQLGDVSRNKAAVGAYARTGATNPPRYQDRRA